MIEFGWRTPDFPVDGSDTLSFRDQQFDFLDALQGSFDSAWIADHFVPWMASRDQSSDTYECWTSLTYFMAKYPRMKFGSIVLSQGYRPPALLAKMASILQVLSGGRLILGIGAGWKEDEYRAYGYDFPPAPVRIRQLAEAVQIIRSMFTQPKTTFHGEYYHIQDAICQPKPTPPPPIMIGGSGRKMTLRVVAQYADWWNGVGISPEEFAEVSEVLAGHCKAVGRDPASIVKTYSTDCLAIAPTTQEAQRLAQSSPFYAPNSGIIGNPDEVEARIRRYMALGVEHIIMRFVDFPRFDGARLFIDEVLPRFKSA